MHSYLSIKDAAKHLGNTERNVRKLCNNGKLPGARKQAGQWYVPTTADVRLLAADGIRQIEQPDLDGVSLEKRAHALRKLGVVQECEEYVAAAGRSVSRLDALSAYAAERGMGLSTLYLWQSQYRKCGLRGLVDTRGCKKESGLQRISSEAFKCFTSMYLAPQQLSVRQCLRLVCFVNKRDERGWIVPSYKVMLAIVDEEIPLSVLVYYREGKAAYNAKCAPYIETDMETIEPGSVWVGDHHQLNCWVRYHNRWVRPWITAWQDMRSRMIVGWYFSASPNQATILRATKVAIEKYGAPDSVKIDNGRDYDSEAWTGTTKAKRKAAKVKAGYIDESWVKGLYSMMGVTVSFAIPYHPQSKAIERWFDTLDCQFTKTIPTYCGKDAKRKPEHVTAMLASDKAIAQAYTLDAFAELTGEYITAFNNSIHTGRGMDGKTPAQVMATRTSRRMMGEGVPDLLMRLWSRELKVGKNGVRFKNMSYGQYDPELQMRVGRKVRVSYDPDDLARVYVYDAETITLITEAEQRCLVGYPPKQSAGQDRRLGALVETF